jgi:transcriptional regulator with PAS, ATPase and Fis domain
VLIVGETGTGKELVARALHEESERAAEPFLAVNCGAISESLLESELFGHESGAFTGARRAHRGLFEAAGRGTLLLDEIGDTSPRLQVALLRVLETGEVRPVGSSTSRKVRCRVLAATNADLTGMVGEGRFRKDLYFRLDRIAIRIPPLRERGEDILSLADHFLSEDRHDGHRPTMSEALKAALLAHQWSGNVRELRGEGRTDQKSAHALLPNSRLTRLPARSAHVQDGLSRLTLCPLPRGEKEPEGRGQT